MQKEIWKEIEGYEGFYQISNLGRVKSIDRFVKGQIGLRKAKGDLKIPTLGKRGYYEIGLNKNSSRKTVKIHRLIALHFIPNPENKPHINHIDGNKLNNKINNLEWCTHAENMRHARVNGLNKDVGETHHNAKLKNSDIIKIRYLRSKFNKTHQEIANIFNVTRKNITSILNNKTWNHVR